MKTYTIQESRTRRRSGSNAKQMKYIGYSVFYLGFCRGILGQHGVFMFRGPEDQGIIVEEGMKCFDHREGVLTTIPLHDGVFAFTVDTGFYGNISFRVDTEGNPINDCINKARENFFTGLSNPIDLGGGIGQHPLTGAKFFLPG